MNNLIEDIKALIIATLDLEDTTPADIKESAPLFIDGLGLDSIDALEIGVALQKTYKIQLSSKSENLKQHFYSVQTIANYIQTELTEQS